jgi:hypothetical protein
VRCVRPVRCEAPEEVEQGGANVSTHPAKRRSRTGRRGEGQRKGRKSQKPNPKPDEDNRRIWDAAKRALRAGKHVWKFDDGYGDGEKWYAILPAPSHDAVGGYPYLFDDDGKFGPYDTAEEAEVAYAECKNGWGYEDEPETAEQARQAEERVRQAEERARQAESNFADMQAQFFQANAEATALKAQMTAEPAAPQPDLKPAPDDPVQGLADDIVSLVQRYSELTTQQVLAALDLARSLINVEQEVFDPDDEPAPTSTQPAEAV